MARKLLVGILGGLPGLLIGVIGGAFLGLVLGGTFLGWLEFNRYPGLTGYELAAYIGALIGALVITPLGVKFALKNAFYAERNG